jgi:hypothetical protein
VRDANEIIVTIDHPFGTVEATLAEWIERGPGPRPLVRPTAARSALTGESLPLAVIPLRYRNDAESRRLIATGKLEPPPWHRP